MFVIKVNNVMSSIRLHKNDCVFSVAPWVSESGAARCDASGNLTLPMMRGNHLRVDESQLFTSWWDYNFSSKKSISYLDNNLVFSCNRTNTSPRLVISDLASLSEVQVKLKQLKTCVDAVYSYRNTELQHCGVLKPCSSGSSRVKEKTYGQQSVAPCHSACGAFKVTHSIFDDLMRVNYSFSTFLPCWE